MKKNGSVAAIVMMMAFVIGLNITGIVPVLSLVSEKYADKSTSTIQLLQTIPYALLIVGSLLVGKLSALFSKKKVRSIFSDKSLRIKLVQYTFESGISMCEAIVTYHSRDDLLLSYKYYHVLCTRYRCIQKIARQ